MTVVKCDHGHKYRLSYLKIVEDDLLKIVEDDLLKISTMVPVAPT
jgi:hypothetical protein